ncbi:hypothetical protein RHOFW510R12_00645 [Rhodanobacter sp. FW510-R12]|uniref:hypothetical protein n=1 Tax=Rhodanobacter thiooxydans TaxID=416169 RepID=UPI000915AB73|nr:hypothetical protein [Rhodanobacter thiooxydans]UJJ56748.1 hypothetical protein LRK53_18195 [Rhodanobacter thiooxydans]
MTLWSPPRISKSALVTTRAACAPLANGLGRAARGAAARRAIRGLRAGRVSPREVEKALGAGEGGLLALLAERAALPETPTIARGAVGNLTSRTVLAAATMEALLSWCRALLADGHVSAEELGAVNETESATHLLRLVLIGWGRLVDGVVDAMGLHSPDAARCAYTIAPATVFRAMDEIIGHSYGIDNLFDDGPHGDGVVVVTDGWPCVDLIADPATDPAFYAAVCEAWDALAVKTHLVVASGDTDHYLGGMLSETLDDLGRTARWEGDVPHFASDAIEQALEEVSWYPPEEFADVAATFLRHGKHARAARAMGAGEREAALQGRTAELALVARLKSLADATPDSLSPFRHRRRATFEVFYSAEGQEHHCALVAQHAGLAAMYESQLQDAQSESAIFFAAHDAQDPSQLLAVAKQGIMQVAAASAALSYVQEYNDAAPPR